MNVVVLHDQIFHRPSKSQTQFHLLVSDAFLFFLHHFVQTLTEFTSIVFKPLEHVCVLVCVFKDRHETVCVIVCLCRCLTVYIYRFI